MTLPGTIRLVPWLARTAPVITCAVAMISAMATAGPAAASTALSSPPPGMLTGTTVARAGLNVHLVKDGGIATSPVITAIPYDSTVYIACWNYDAQETGPWGTTKVWDALAGYRPPGGSYQDLSHDGGVPFVTDAWVDTGGDTSSMTLECG